MLILLVILVSINLILMFLFVLKNKNSNQDKINKKFEDYEKRLDLYEKGFKDEFARSRKEATENERESRKETQETLINFQNSISIHPILNLFPPFLIQWLLSTIYLLPLISIFQSMILYSHGKPMTARVFLNYLIHILESHRIPLSQLLMISLD